MIEYFKPCVETVRQHTQAVRFIFVSDGCDAAHDQEMQEYIKRFPESLYLRTPKQLWFTRAHNLGLRFARTPWVVMLNADTVVDAGWLEDLYDVRDAVSAEGYKVGLVGVEQSGEEQRRYHRTAEPGFVTGHCYLASMDALYEASANRGTPGIYLDETQQKTIHIYSDNEICYRMNQLGWTTVTSFKTAVGHHGGKAWGYDLSVLGLPLDAVAPRWI
jgi:GT2 family glycosyltransferase